MNYGYDNQYSTTSYSAAGAGGGGFINTGSQQDGNSNSKGGGKDSLRPVTIKQLNDADQPHPDADFEIDGAGVGQVTFVGQIRQISSQVTNYTYKIDDGTGTVDVKLWIDPDAGATNLTDEEGNPKLKDGDYVRAFGTLKNLNDRKYVGARTGGIKPVIDHNEVNYHLLEATAVHLFFKHGPPGGSKQANGTNGAYANGDDPMDTSGGMSRMPAGISQNAKKVMHCLNTTADQSNEGLHLQNIAASLNMDAEVVQKAGQELLDNGMIYTTVDDYTWAVLDGL